jgi:8-oxo-dGTP pyrophosphatase MutT (NUDIX family)
MCGGVRPDARTPRLAVRGLILIDDRLLLVNAYPGEQSDLWCAPGGGVEPGTSLPENLIREVAEETGLRVEVGALALVNEFHDPASGFHQVDLFFRCSLPEPENGRIPPEWRDPEGVVNRHRLVTRADYAALRVKPDSLGAAAWGGSETPLYDALEVIVR